MDDRTPTRPAVPEPRGAHEAPPDDVARHYRLIAENASDVVLEIGLDERVLWASPSVERVLGWRPGDLVGLDAVELTHPDDRDRLALARRFDREGGSSITEFRIRRADEGYRWVSGVSHDVVDDDVLVSRVVIFTLEPDALRIERARVRDERERLRAVLDSELDPRVVLSAVRDGDVVLDFRVVDSNRAARAWIGDVDITVGGRTLGELLPAEVAEGMVAQYARSLTSGEPLVRDALRMPGGPLRESDGWYDVRVSPLDDGVTVSWRDVTERELAAARLAASEERFRLLAENARDVVLHIVHGEVRWVSPSLLRVLGWNPDAWVGTPLLDLVDPEVRESTRQAWERLHGGWSGVLRTRLRDAEGDHHWVEGQAGPYHDAQGVAEGVIASFRLVDDEVAAHEALRTRAERDPLTGLLNRAEALDRLDGLLRDRRGGRRSGDHLAVVFCDVDGFKTVNDALGHPVGDVVLREVAQRLLGVVRDSDLVARFGGDELLVVADGLRGPDDAERIADKLRAAVLPPLELAEGAVELTLSIGVALARSGEGVDRLVTRADDAMFRAKRRGGDGVEMAT